MPRPMHLVRLALPLALFISACASDAELAADEPGAVVEGGRDATVQFEEDAFQGQPFTDLALDPPPVPDMRGASPFDSAVDAAPDAPVDAALDGGAGPVAPLDATGESPPNPLDGAAAQVDAAAPSEPDAAPRSPDVAPPLEPDAALACASDLECPFDALCIAGVCHAGGVPCVEAAECRTGDTCRLGFCAPGAAACADDGGCVAGEICEARACLPAECVSDEECVAPAVCVAGRCGVAGAVELCNGLDDEGDGRIDDGARCEGAQLCRQGACVEPACPEGATRLVSGATPHDGRLEICVRGVWGTVCLAGFEDRAARIACRTAGLPEAAPTFGGAPGVPPAQVEGRPIWIAGVRCEGGEASLLECPVAEALGAGCTHGHDVGLDCPDGPPPPPPELCNGADEDLDGLVDEGEPCGADARCLPQGCVPIQPETCNGADDDLNGSIDEGELCGADARCLGGVCLAVAPESCNGVDDDLNGLVDDGPLCAEGELCFNAACVVSGPEACNGADDNLDGRVDEGVLCGIGDACLGGVCQVTPCDEGRLRLLGGPTADSGRVEVCHAGAWGTVCDDGWDGNDARVVCGQLGFGTAGVQARSFASFGEGAGQIWLDDLGCGGNEASLQQCAHPGWGQHNCAHSEDAGVVCGADEGVVPGVCAEGAVRLVDGFTATSGRVEICHQATWGTVCDDAWDDADAAVVCRQLGMNPDGALAYGVSFFGEGAGNIWLDEVSCGGVEADLSSCGHPAFGDNDCSHFEDAGVECGF